jgi:hypothetical protein
MATIAIGEEARAAAMPYQPGWLDRFIAWLDGLPGPTAVAYLGLLAVAVVISNAQNWMSGLSQLGRLSPTQTLRAFVSAIALPLALFMIQRLLVQLV